MKHRVLGLLVPWALVLLIVAPAFGQGGGSISGTVMDTAGGAVPGVTVVVTNEAGASFETVTNSQGVFSVPALSAGTYTGTVSLTGFFASVTPRQDAIEAVTVTTAVAGANIGGSGGVVINFATRSGTSRFSGSLYEYYRNPSMNDHAWRDDGRSPDAVARAVVQFERTSYGWLLAGTHLPHFGSG